MKRFLSFALCMALIVGLAGCTQLHPAVAVSDPSANTAAEEPVQLDWYVNFSWYNTPWGGNAVSRAVTEKTGVDIHFVSPDGSESVTLDALIAGNKLPDLVTLGFWEPQLNEIIEGELAYALNELASNPIYTISLSFLTFFYTDVLGMEVGLVGLIILVSKIFDGISDLWAGNLIDHTHTKSGSARPWVLRSAVLMAAA